MKNKFVKILMVGLVILSGVYIGCTKNACARNWGGTVTETLPPDRKLVNITWKDSNIWILTRPSTPGETPMTYEFNESSSWGNVEGKVIIVETSK